MKHWILGVLAVAGLAVFPACTERESVIEQRAEKVGDKAEDIGDGIENGAKRTGEKVAE